MKPRIKIYDNIFAHAHTMSNGYLKLEPELFTWYRGDEHTEIAFYTDFSLAEIDNHKEKHRYNIALLMESPSVFGGPYNQIKEMEDKFDYIFTFDAELLKRGDKYQQYYLGGTWIPENDWAIYHKTKFISMIASDKDNTYGQKLRHEVKKKLGHRVDIYGDINNKPINDKLTGLRDYMFSIVTENCDDDTYFTEKLIDCFLTGTIPVYFGCEKVNDIFWPGGIYCFNSIEYLKEIFKPLPNALSPELYNQHIGMVARNFNKAKEFATPENMIALILKGLKIL